MSVAFCQKRMENKGFIFLRKRNIVISIFDTIVPILKEAIFIDDAR